MTVDWRPRVVASSVPSRNVIQRVNVAGGDLGYRVAVTQDRA